VAEIKKNIEILSLVYKSIDYLNFIADQFKSDLVKLEGWDVGVRLVANDATPKVLEALKHCGVPYTVFNNPDPSEYYINRVYRAYNFCVESTTYDNVCLLNSDNVMSKDWLKNVLRYHNGINIPCSRFIESGKMPSGRHAVNLGNNHFGRKPDEFDYVKWNQYAEMIKINEAHLGGIYGACVFEKERFLEAGGYPEGNLYFDGVGTVNGHPIKSSDDYFFHDVLEAKYGMQHVTVFDSIVYHIIEGEKDA